MVTKSIGRGSRRRGVASVRSCSSTNRSWVERMSAVGASIVTGASVVVGCSQKVMDRMVENLADYPLLIH